MNIATSRRHVVALVAVAAGVLAFAGAARAQTPVVIKRATVEK